MTITRVYADEQGESHFADEEIELRDAGSIGHLSEPIPADSRAFVVTDGIFFFVLGLPIAPSSFVRTRPGRALSWQARS